MTTASIDRAGTTPRTRALRRAGAVAGWLAIAAVCLLALAALALRIADWRPLAVQSGSMEPRLRQGDLIVVAPQPARAVRAGDVITFARPGHPGETLTHRVVAVRRGVGAADGRLAVTTRGDANPAPERWSIPLDGTVGELRMRLPHVGALAAPLRGDVSTVAAVIAATGLLSALALWAIWRPRGGRRR